MLPKGVFKDLVNRKGFVDRIVLSLWGKKRDRPLQWVRILKNKPIGGAKKYYARCIEAVHAVTGNPIELRYGRLKRFLSIPPCRLDCRSEHVPLTGAQIAHVAHSLLRTGFRGYISQVEFTFDLEGFPLTIFSQDLFTRASRFSETTGFKGRRTLYIGGPHSRWQLRVYQKTNSLTRVEFILRRPFLLSADISQVPDAVILNGVDLSQLASWKQFDPQRLRQALSCVPSGWKKEQFLNWPHQLPTQMLAKCLQKGLRIKVRNLLHPTKAEVTLRRMAKRFMW